MRGFFATVAMLSSLLASGQYFNNGVCCDPDAWDYFGSGTCFSIAEDPGVFDGAVCDSDCSGYNDGLGCLDASCESGFCYSLTVEASPAAVIPDATTYRFYVNFDDANDQISAVFGNNEMPLEVNVPEGAFNSEINLSWNASGINPAFVAIFPELADDTFATLGLIGPASTSGIDGAADPQLAEDAGQPITPFFNTDGATSLLSNSIIGASWFTINTAQNAYAGDDLTLMVMQVTTTGSISGTLNFQLFNQFDLSPDAITEAVQVSVAFDGAGTFSPNGDVVAGCTDEAACNFAAGASSDNGSCQYVIAGNCDCDGNVLDALGECGGNCLSDANSDGICDGDEVPGCLNESACNYNPEANTQDLENPCLFADYGFCCDGTPDVDEDGVCDADEVSGCTAVYACNYEPDATLSDDSCDFDSCVGCTFEIACNYNPEATIEDGSCVFFCPGCLDEEACNFDPFALQEDGSCEYASDLGWCDCSGATELDAVGVCGGDCLEDLDADGVCDGVDDCIGFFDACGVCNGPGEIYACGCSGLPEGACDCEGQTVLDPCGVCGGDGSTCTGCTDSGACNYEPTAIIDGGCEYDTCAGCTYEFACNYDPEATIQDFASCEFGTCPGCTDFNACNYNPTITEDDGSCTYGTFAVLFRVDMQNEEVSPFGVHVAGNFQGWDPSGNPMFDSDGDGVYEAWVSVDASTIGDQIEYKFINGNDWTDPNEILCTSCGGDYCHRILNLGYSLSCDSEIVLSADAEGSPFCFNSCEACVEPVLVTFTVDMSYVSEVSSEGVHLAGAFQGWDPTSTPLSDNGDGTFGVTLEIEPGTYEFQFINGNAWGNDEDLIGLPCAPNGSRIATFDVDNNTYTACFNSCHQCQAGCTDPTACNYDMDADSNDGSCTYASFPYDCSNECLNDADGDGVCDSDETVGCTDPFACNGGFFTDTDNSQCVYADEACEFCIAGEVVLFDEDGDGVCNGDETVGCTDPLACNGGFFTDTDNSQCIYADEACEICVAGDVVLFDADGDGVCDSDEVSGCTDVLACNFDGFATDEDDSCLYLDQCGVCGGEGIPAGNCDCDGNQLDALGECGGDCESDENGNGICDSDENGGGSAYCGWGTYWNEDSAACVLLIPPFDGEFGDYSSLNPCYFDLDLSGEVGANDLLNLLNTYGQEAGCSWSED